MHHNCSCAHPPQLPMTEQSKAMAFRTGRRIKRNSRSHELKSTAIIVIVILGGTITLFTFMNIGNGASHSTVPNPKIGKDLKPSLFGRNVYIPFNPRYHVPESSEVVGDRSDRYINLREEVDAELPVDPVRSLARVNELTKHISFQTVLRDISDMDGVIPYDIHHCPDTPPTNYPYAWNVLHILEHWPPNDPIPRPLIHQSVCVFDYDRDYKKALTYRDAELPFVVVNDPAVARSVERWATPGYVTSMLGEEEHNCEYSENNHFMYYVPIQKGRAKMVVPEGWKEPTTLIRMSYDDWLEHANVTDDNMGPDKPHWYFRIMGCGLMGNNNGCENGSSEYLFDELPWFQPQKSLYVVDPAAQNGILCRFGMKGVIAESHFDGSRNAIAVLGGSRRYVLAHPSQCTNLAVFLNGHPSARHSAIDWSNPNLEAFPQFKEAMGNEVVLQAGQVLYLPSNWFHYIISLDLNVQCNTRSGASRNDHLHSCGF